MSIPGRGTRVGGWHRHIQSPTQGHQERVWGLRNQLQHDPPLFNPELGQREPHALGRSRVEPILSAGWILNLKMFFHFSQNSGCGSENERVGIVREPAQQEPPRCPPLGQLVGPEGAILGHHILPTMCPGHCSPVRWPWLTALTDSAVSNPRAFAHIPPLPGMWLLLAALLTPPIAWPQPPRALQDRSSLTV